ncbi:hypothetical protein HZA99_04640 [Candidatus Woesearchaeota archaeon]|nr:hypothetical protein [Candidatus Woesearchaeota archaeon]
MTGTTNMFGEAHTETLDDFFTLVDRRNRIALAVDDEAKIRKDVAQTLFATDRFLPGETDALQQIVTSLPEGMIALETPPLDEASILLTASGEHALALSWELYDKGLQATVKIFDINIERDEKQTRIPMNGLRAASYMAGFDHAPVIVYTAYAKDHLTQSRFESSVPMFLVEKSPASLDTLKDVVVAAQHYADVMAQLRTTLKKREDYISGLAEGIKEFKKRLGVSRSEDYERLAYQDFTIDQTLTSDILDLAGRIPSYTGFESHELTAEMGATFETLQTKASIVNNYNIRREYDDLITRVENTSRNIRRARESLSAIQALARSSSVDGSIYSHLQTAESALNPETGWADILAFDELPTRSELSYVTKMVTNSAPETVAVTSFSLHEGQYDTQRLGLVALGIRQTLVAYDSALVDAEIKGARDPAEAQLEMTESRDHLKIICSFHVPADKKDAFQMYLGAHLQDVMCNQIFRKADPTFAPETMSIGYTPSGIEVRVELQKGQLYMPL